MDAFAKAAATATQKKFSRGVVEILEYRGEQTLLLAPEALFTACDYLKKQQQYTFLSTVTAVDWPERVPRFDIVYQLLSIPRRSVLALKVRVGNRREQHPEVSSVTK